MRQVCVLVVDDDPDIRLSLTWLLEAEGFAVAAASNGAEALALLRSDVAPEFILLDLSMPVMSGQQFRAHQLTEPTLATIPTVVMSAADRVHEKVQGMQVAQVLPKPFPLERLLELANRYCGRSAAPP